MTASYQSWTAAGVLREGAVLRCRALHLGYLAEPERDRFAAARSRRPPLHVAGPRGDMAHLLHDRSELLDIRTPGRGEVVASAYPSPLGRRDRARSRRPRGSARTSAERRLLLGARLRDARAGAREARPRGRPAARAPPGAGGRAACRHRRGATGRGRRIRGRRGRSPRVGRTSSLGRPPRRTLPSPRVCSRRGPAPVRAQPAIRSGRERRPIDSSRAPGAPARRVEPPPRMRADRERGHLRGARR